MDTMTFSGGGSERDNALQGGCRQNARSFISGVDRERATFPLGLSQAIQHRDLVGGDLVSLKEGKIVPLDRSLPFSGIIESVSEDRGRYIGSVTTRGAIVVRVEGLSPETRSGSRVYALPGIRTLFTLDDNGVEIGEVLAVESVERERAIVGVRVPSDTRGFEMNR